MLKAILPLTTFLIILVSCGNDPKSTKDLSKDKDKVEELTREFKRDFTLPANVDPYSIKAQLDEATRLLTLIGQLTPTKAVKESAELSNINGLSNQKVGTIRENRTQSFIEYEIFLGDSLKDGQPSIELSGYNNLVVKVNSKGWDTFGDYDFQLTRQIKMPPGADAHQISHGIDLRKSSLLVKVPIKSVF